MQGTTQPPTSLETTRAPSRRIARWRRAVVVCAAAAVGLPAAARADGDPFGTVVVRGARPDEANDLSSTTRIYLDESRAQQTSVAEVLAGEAGVRVRSRGGVGSFQSVSIRGSEAAEVAVLLDGAPISRAGFGLVDLSQLPIEGLERIEVYRGTAPLGFGSEAIGGVINLVSRRGGGRPTRSATLGGGSFGARLVGATVGEALGRWRGLATATYRGATGDYWYYDNGGTLFLRDDDRERQRRNNGFDQLAATATLSHVGRFDTQLTLHGLWRRAGVPGFATLGVETRRARLDAGRLFVNLKTQGLLPADVRLVVLPSFELERLAFSNPTGELVGPFGPSVQDSLVLAGGLQARADRRFGRGAHHQLVSLLGELRGESRQATNLLATQHSAPLAGRVTGALGLADQASLWRERLILEGALRLDGLASFLRPEGKATAADRRWFLSPRLGLRATVHRLLTLRASGGRFVRNPTLLELFGDGGLFLPAPTLRSERAWGGELGLHLEAPQRIVKILVDLAAFGRRVDDLIAYIPGQNGSTAINIAAARVLGGELRASLDLHNALRLRLDYTLLDARNLSDEAGVRGKRLPGRAPHEARATIEIAGLGLRLGYTAHYVGQVYRDERNLAALPDYVLHELELRYQTGAVTVSTTVQNLGDLRTRPLPLGGSAQAGQTTPYPLVDTFNYPLPGRAVYATVTVAP